MSVFSSERELFCILRQEIINQVPLVSSFGLYFWVRLADKLGDKLECLKGKQFSGVG